VVNRNSLLSVKGRLSLENGISGVDWVIRFDIRYKGCLCHSIVRHQMEHLCLYCSYFINRAGQSRMSDLARSEGLYEDTEWLPSYHAGSIKSEPGTSSYSMNGITTFSSQWRGNYESSDACINNASDYAQSTHFLAPGPQTYSHQTTQSPPPG